MGVGGQIVVGLTGPFGAGCTTIADDLKDRKGWLKYSLSDAMRELAPSRVDDLDKEKLFSPECRAYQQEVGNRIRKIDITAIPAWIVNKIKEAENSDESLKSKNIVVDSIRNPSEMTYLRDTFPNFFVVAVFAPYYARWERKRDIYSGKQDDFDKDDVKDSGEFEPPYGQQVQLCVDRSDILISNDRPFTEPRIKRELQIKVDTYIDLMQEPGSMGPHPWELNMSQAYQASLMSTCCKRKVGAVIVREEAVKDKSRSYIIASGYNEVPVNVRSCVERGGGTQSMFCYKDERIKAELKGKYKLCPNCGSKLEFPEEFELPFVCPNESCRARLGKDFIPGRTLDLCIAVHAEEAAILQASKFGGTQIEGSTLYTTTFPCDLCAKMIIQTGITRIIFAEPYPGDEAVGILEEAKISPELFEGVKGRAYHRLFEPSPYKT